MEFITSIVQSFNPEEVFTSLQGFLGSGYIFVVVAGILAFGLIKKLLKLITIGVVAGLVWLACSSGMVDQFLSALGMG